PHKGANRNCMSEKLAIKVAINQPDSSVLNFLAYTGNSGRTIAKPSRSMNTVRKITASDPREAGFSCSCLWVIGYWSLVIWHWHRRYPARRCEPQRGVPPPECSVYDARMLLTTYVERRRQQGLDRP